MDSSAAFSQLAARCSARETCLSEARAKLERLELTPAQCDAILQRLVSEGYIDEARYARAFVSDKLLPALEGIRDDTIRRQALSDAKEQLSLAVPVPYDWSLCWLCMPGEQ